MRRTSVALFLASAALAAGEPAPAPAPAAADPTVAAKQDLADIRATTVPTDGVSALSGITVPDVTMPASSQPPSPLLFPDSELGPDGFKKKKEGTGNWLIDAMEKQEKEAKADKAPSHGKDREELVKADLDLLRGDDKEGNHPDRELMALDPAKAKSEVEDAKPPAYNPLDAFMNSWISAKDHDLLLPAKTEGTGPAHGEAGNELGAAGPSEYLLGPAESAVGPETKAGLNPYLAELDLPPPPATTSGFNGVSLSVLVPTDLSEPAPVPVLTGLDSRPIDSTRTVIPDFAQPSEDDKYFPQLKKF